ncbi:UDP-glucose dehydrogenase family protein [Halobacillus seohaensis]|uniref:UDP-glucose 6-dehydrogenase n=1 Tax=Halobacillus seohaensis TaxID=447421 RepID=A0ABW2EJG6_9BACI
MNILFIGMGYVGTTMGVVLAKSGHNVTGLDIDQDKIATLNKGELYFHEPNLQKMLLNSHQNKNLYFTSEPKEAIENNDIVFITVGTPSLENGKADLTYVKSAAKMIGKYINSPKTIVVKSTVPIGTTEQIKQWINQESQSRFDINMVMNPEFLREGTAVQDALHPDRIVIGSEDRKSLEILDRVYQSWSCPILKTTPKAAEMIKYASNAFLATKISFINEVAKLCDTLDINVQDVSKGMGLDNRIGPAFLQAGLGYGGSCFPKDVKELLRTANSYRASLHILKEVEMINHIQYQYFLEKVKNNFVSLKGKKVTIFGLSFKPHTDDTRDSVSFSIMNELVKEKADIVVHDPVVSLSTNWLDKGIKQYSDPYDAVKSTDIILICTNWPVYQELDWRRIRKIVSDCYIFDGRNMLEASEMKKLNFHYEGIGYS